jgi:hypothetical protein
MMARRQTARCGNFKNTDVPATDICSKLQGCCMFAISVCLLILAHLHQLAALLAASMTWSWSVDVS